MAPEQATGASKAGSAADRYSFAAVLYRALTGRAPIEGGADLVSQLQQLAQVRPLRPTILLPALPAQVDHVMAVALAKEPAARFESCRELVDALEQAGRGALDAAAIERAVALQPTLDADPTLMA